MKLLRFLWTAMVYACVATVVTLGIGLYMFWSKGGLEGNRKAQLLAVLSGLDVYDLWKQAETMTRQQPAEQAPYEVKEESRIRSGLDLDLREQSVRRSIAEMKFLETQVRDERAELDQVRQSFVAEIDRKEKDNNRIALQELQETMQSLSPKQAKEQILMWLNNPQETYPLPDRDVTDDVVTLIKGMSSDRQAKLFKEFKGDRETKQLNSLLEKIRRGDQQEINAKARKRLDEANADDTQGNIR